MAPQRARLEKRVLSKQSVKKRKKAAASPDSPSKDRAGMRAAFGVLVLAASALGLLALVTFDPRGSPHNAAGPMGHLLASALLQGFGICAYVAPATGVYLALLLFSGRRGRRWPHWIAAALLVVSVSILTHLMLANRVGWGPLPAGIIGRYLSDILSSQFSTGGTVILVVAAIAVSLLVGTRVAFLKLCALAWRAALSLGRRTAGLVVAIWRAQQSWLNQRREQGIQSKLEEDAFLTQLEADSQSATNDELAAAEAEEIANAAYEGSSAAEDWAAAKELAGRDVSARRERKPPQIVTMPPAPDGRAPGTLPITVPALESAIGAPSPEAIAARPSALSRMPLIVEPKTPPQPAKKKAEQFEFVGDRKSFTPPPLDVLDFDKKERSTLDKDAFLSTAEKLRAKLADFGITGEVVEIRPGPVVTMYEFLPGPGIKLSKIAALADDLAMAMEAMRVRIVAPIPGKGVVGIEVPNRDRELVFLKEIAEQDVFLKSHSKLTMCLGKDIEGMPYVLDLARAPHLLIAGTTGSGKSVAVNSMIMSLLLKATPEDVRFIMVDPKMLELSTYEGIPHLLLPVVTDPKKAALALRWAVEEMERRYQVLSDAGVRNIAGYNKLVETSPASARDPLRPSGSRPRSLPDPALPPAPGRKVLVVDVAEGESEDQALERARQLERIGVPAPNPALEGIREPLSPDSRAEAVASEASATGLSSAERKELKKLPYIVVIIDELADLMMVAPREVETYVTRLAQMARAAGIHLMVATQRPSTDVVTGVIKANFPTRISFMLRTKPDSMTILGTTGAEALLGMGDMLLSLCFGSGDSPRGGASQVAGQAGVRRYDSQAAGRRGRRRIGGG